MDKDRKEVLRLYNKIQEEYELESLEVLEEELGLYFAVPTAFVNELLTHVVRRLQSIRNSINIFYQPTSFIENYESNFLSNKEKEEIFPFFKKLISFDWEYASEFNKGARERAEFLKKALKFYREEGKPFITKFATKLKKEWLAEAKKKDVSRYIH